MNDTPIALDRESLEDLVTQVVGQAAELIYQAQGHGGLNVSRSWIYQRPEQVRDQGAKAAPWYCGWIDPDGKRKAKSCGPGPDGRRAAQKLKRQVEAQLLTGTYGAKAEGAWKDFRREYETLVLARLAWETQRVAANALDAFERIIGPGKVSGVKAATIDRFAAARRQEASLMRKGERISPATLNKELRNLKTALRRAKKWGYISEVPDFDFEREPKKLPAYLPPDDFAKLYEACRAMTKPADQPYPAADWWRGLLVTIYQTGWRVGAVLALKRADVDLDAGTALTQAEDTKGRRDQRVPLHPVVIDHLRRLPSFADVFFPWPHHRRTLDVELTRLREAAGVARYGFHAAKRAFCTMNAPRLDEATLHWLAQHQSFETTRKYYINPEAHAREAVGKLYVPDVLKRAQ